MFGVAVVPLVMGGLMSFSLDLSGLVDFASTIFNALSPIVVILGGIVLGLGLVILVLKLIMGAVKGAAKG